MSSSPKVDQGVELTTVRYSQSNVSKHFTPQPGSAKPPTPVLNDKLLTNLPPMVVVPLEDINTTRTSLDNRRRLHLDHHAQKVCDVLSVPYALSCRKYKQEEIYKLPQVLGQPKASQIGSFYQIHLGLWDNEAHQLILFSWKVKTIGQVAEARCFSQGNDFPIYGRVQPRASVNHDAYDPLVLNIRQNDNRPPTFSPEYAQTFTSAYCATNTIAISQANTFAYKVRQIDQILPWLRSDWLRTPNATDCYDLITGEKLENDEDKISVTVQEREREGYGKEGYEEAFPSLTSTKSTDLYRWKVGGGPANGHHCTVKTNADLENVPFGTTFNATIGDMRMWNDEWFRYYGEEESEEGPSYMNRTQQDDQHDQV